MANDLCRSKIMGISDKEICKEASVYSKHLFGQNQTFSKGLGFLPCWPKGMLIIFYFLMEIHTKIKGSFSLSRRYVWFDEKLVLEMPMIELRNCVRGLVSEQKKN